MTNKTTKRAKSLPALRITIPTARTNYASLDKRVSNAQRTLDALLTQHRATFIDNGATSWTRVGDVSHIALELEKLVAMLQSASR